jgi:hypothetical protein
MTPRAVDELEIDPYARVARAVLTAPNDGYRAPIGAMSACQP